MNVTGAVFDTSWRMRNGDKLVQGMASMCGILPEMVSIRSVRPGSVIVEYEVSATTPTEAANLAFRLRKSIDDGSLSDALLQLAFHGCGSSGEPAASCAIVSKELPRVTIVLQSRELQQVDELESKNKLVEVLRQVCSVF
jgi:hypothetical protein